IRCEPQVMQVIRYSVAYSTGVFLGPSSAPRSNGSPTILSLPSSITSSSGSEAFATDAGATTGSFDRLGSPVRDAPLGFVVTRGFGTDSIAEVNSSSSALNWANTASSAWLIAAGTGLLAAGI